MLKKAANTTYSSSFESLGVVWRYDGGAVCARQAKNASSRSSGWLAKKAERRYAASCTEPLKDKNYWKCA